MKYFKIFSLFIAYLICQIIVGYYVKHYYGSTEYLNSQSLNISFIIIIAHNVFLIPIIEEIIFRLSLVYSRKFIRVSIYGILFYIIFYQEFIALTRGVNIITLLKFGIFISITIWFGKFVTNNFYLALERFWISYKNAITYVSIVLFTVLHILNFNLSEIDIFVACILLSPYLLAGIFYSYIRLKYGFVFGIICHSLQNSLSIFVMLYLLNVSMADILNGATIESLTNSKMEHMYSY